MSACDEEPCKSLIEAYWMKVAEAKDAELAVRLHCDVKRIVLRDYAVLFGLWAAVFASAIACHALWLPPVLCAALTAASLLLLALLLVWAVRILFLSRLTRIHQAMCRRCHSEMLSLRRQIAVRCPRECQPGAVPVKCDC